MTSISCCRARVTRALYHTEAQIIEKIPHMIRARSLSSLQKRLDQIWHDWVTQRGSQRPKPLLRFGPGVRHGRYRLSYTQDTDPGQVIELAPGGRNWYVLAHELAHALGPSEHGIGFARVYHDLLNHRTFKTIMSTPRGQEFLEYLRVEHPRQVRRIYRRR
jgi:hypothetical protein